MKRVNRFLRVIHYLRLIDHQNRLVGAVDKIKHACLEILHRNDLSVQIRVDCEPIEIAKAPKRWREKRVSAGLRDKSGCFLDDEGYLCEGPYSCGDHARKGLVFSTADTS